MLDRKIEDVDASIELLTDRKRKVKITFFIFFIIGWALVWFSVWLLSYKYDELGIGVGISFLIFATWFLMLWLFYDIMIKLQKPLQKE